MTQDFNASRRRFLTVSGTGLVLIPLVNLTGCAEETAEPIDAPAEPMDQPTPPQGAAPEAAAPDATADVPPPPGDEQPAEVDVQLVRLEESDPQAQALGYRHDATTVDTAQYPTFAEGQICGNCSLYLVEAGDDPEWGGCSIFPGKLVNVNGWCSAYVPAPQS